MSRSKTTESNLWVWLKKGGKQFRSRLHMNRVENMVLSGMPDVEGCLDDQQFWIELKCEPRPARSTTLVKAHFRPAQIPWMKRRLKAGGLVSVLLQVGSGHDAARYLVHSGRADEMASGLTETELLRLAYARADAPAREIIYAASLRP